MPSSTTAHCPTGLRALPGRTAAILGAGATGQAAAPVLHQCGFRVLVFDDSTEEQLGERAARLRPYADVLAGAGRHERLDECDFLIPSPGARPDHPLLIAARRRGIPVIPEIEAAQRLTEAPIVAITGTNGKTTTVLMTAAVLCAAGLDAIVAGNTLSGGYQAPLIGAAVGAPTHRWLVAEVSSFQLELTERFRPRVAGITNITADHLNRHGSVEEYVAAKARLLRAQEADDWTILNLDNAASRSLIPQARGRLLRVARRPHPHEGGWTEEIGRERWLRARLDGRELDLMPAGELRIPGEHTIENALFAACAGLAAGAGPEAVRSALGGFQGVPDRLEPVATVRGVLYINNTMCTNVDAAVRSIEAIDRPLVLIAGGKGKGLDFDPLGAAIAARVRSLICIGEEGPQIGDAARRHGAERILTAGSMAEAVRLAAEEASPDVVVMLAPACASFDWYGSFEERGRDFRREVERLAAEAEL